MYGNDVGYARSRLEGTIILHNSGTPVSVDRVSRSEDRKGIVIYSHDIVDPMTTYNSPIEDFNFEPVRMGFCESKVGLAFLTRVPKRNDWRQGLRANNYQSVWGPDARMVGMRQLKRSIMNRYPPLEYCCDESICMQVSKPFSRDFAVSYNGHDEKLDLLYKWFGKVGDVLNYQPILSPEFEYLNGPLEEAVR